MGVLRILVRGRSAVGRGRRTPFSVGSEVALGVKFAAVAVFPAVRVKEALSPYAFVLEEFWANGCLRPGGGGLGSIGGGPAGGGYGPAKLV